MINNNKNKIKNKLITITRMRQRISTTIGESQNMWLQIHGMLQRQVSTITRRQD